MMEGEAPSRDIVSPEEQQHQQNGTPTENGAAVIGSAAMRPIFLGNLNPDYTAADVTEMFERPLVPKDLPQDAYPPMPVERVDVKRGYCFVFLKDAQTQEDKEAAERFVSDINGMAVPNVTNALRAEFARGDGRTKRKEDERRKRISPSETLFVVNFHEATTRQEDLRMLFEPYGELVRIDMKRNYAFVQFRTIEEATRAKEVTNGGKLDQSVLTVEYVARRRDRDGGGGGGGDRRRRDDRRRDDRRRSGGGPPPPRDRDYGRRDDRYYDDRRSPPRERYYRGRSRSRSRSPPRHYRSRSPPRDRYYYDDDRPPRGRSPPDGAGYRGRSPDDGYRGSRGRSSDRESYGRGGDRDRGYRA